MKRNTGSWVSQSELDELRKSGDSNNEIVEFYGYQLTRYVMKFNDINSKLIAAEDKLARIGKLAEHDTCIPAGGEDSTDRCDILIRPARIREILGND